MEITGLKTCPNWLKQKYKIAVNFTCQSCHKKTKDLEIHRIKRGNRGGLYTLVPLNNKNNNVKVLCSDCHKKYHSNELGVTK
jgi:5-methylcytosine-specific restriction endonuclease McrA